MWWKRRSEKQSKELPREGWESKVSFPPLETLRDALSLLPGEWESFFRGIGYEFADLRPFQPGDEGMRIHIPSLIKTGKKLVIERVPERSLDVTIVVDFSDSINSSELLRALRRLAVILPSVGAIDQDNSLSFIGFSDKAEEYFPFSTSPIQIQRIWNRLLLEKEKTTTAKRRTDFSAAEAAIAKFCPAESLIFFVSDFLVSRESRAKLLSAVARRFDFTPVVLDWSGFFENFPSGSWLISATDAEVGTSQSIFLSGSQRNKLAGWARAHLAELEEQFLQYKLTYVVLKSLDLIHCRDEFTKCFRKKIQQRR